ncbi:polysaccharide pyruvyl transferase family protein [Priestia megaterium]|uniref:polysaccharide pyruvyl transferase family protein n=1 Tax=Priestia megaterium TaxID=1404 RepID=UPI002E1F07B2|nr:polysaccharide pyruvyl transferase family protein [Priestia megaterium]MED4279913.1 polysaccharide pyruvyl transferase family protein [Priestia megaterium]MED4319265.1 polysaccharide pyruvyl transferase family protein [Priestia megaterium]
MKNLKRIILNKNKGLKKMKKVMIYAYTEFNLGDDLFIKILCERYPDTQFVLYAPRQYKVLFEKLNNISFFPSDLLFIKANNYILRKFGVTNFFRSLTAKNCDAAVYIGGSLFIQEGNWIKHLENTKSMRIKNKPFFLLGANFGPFTNHEFYSKYKDLFRQFTDICFREKHSHGLFKELNNVRVADDIIFQLKKLPNRQEEKNIVISVIKPSFREDLSNYDDIYYQKMRDIAIYFVERGYRVTFMSFCEFQGDQEAIEKITMLIPKNYLNKISSHFYKTNIDETLEIIANSSFIVATRFHSMILGWIFNKPVFPIVYSKKMTNVMTDVGFNGLYANMNNIGELKPNDVFEGMKTNLIDVSNQIKDAERHFEKLDEYLLK